MMPTYAQNVTQDWLLMVAKLQLPAGHFPNFAYSTFHPAEVYFGSLHDGKNGSKGRPFMSIGILDNKNMLHHSRCKPIAHA
jgi:hypothetical protein